MSDQLDLSLRVVPNAVGLPGRMVTIVFVV
jgi:hypothetical protein